MNLSKKQLKALCQTARKAAIAAGQYIQLQVDEHHKKHFKAGVNSLASQVVTAVDIKAQELILAHLQESVNTYDLGLLTEEAVDNQSRAEKSYFWCIDPLDGTLPFTEGRTGYAVSIGLVTREGDPMIGVVYVPDLKACYTSIKGEGVHMNDVPFVRLREAEDVLHVYIDRSLQSEVYFDEIICQLEDWISGRNKTKVEYHADFGAVRNALGVMHSASGCYFKFPKNIKGSGSIWDYAATRLFFEELGLSVSKADGSKLHLNNPQTTFMNGSGCIYTTESSLSQFIVAIGQQVAE